MERLHRLCVMHSQQARFSMLMGEQVGRDIMDWPIGLVHLLWVLWSQRSNQTVNLMLEASHRPFGAGI